MRLFERGRQFLTGIVSRISRLGHAQIPQAPRVTGKQLVLGQTPQNPEIEPKGSAHDSRDFKGVVARRRAANRVARRARRITRQRAA